MKPHITKTAYEETHRVIERLIGAVNLTLPLCKSLPESDVKSLCERCTDCNELIIRERKLKRHAQLQMGSKRRKKSSACFLPVMSWSRSRDKKNWEGRSRRRAHFDAFSASKFNYKYWPSLRTSSLAFSLLVWTKIRYTHNNRSSSVIKHIALWDTQGLNPASYNLAFPPHTHCSEIWEWGNLSEISSCNSCYLTFVTELCFLSVSFSFVISSLK